jgi:hypothetical protein
MRTFRKDSLPTFAPIDVKMNIPPLAPRRAAFNNPVQARCAAVYTDAQGYLRVTAQAIRSGITYPNIIVQGQYPLVNDWGLIFFADADGDAPVFISFQDHGFPAEATIESVSGSTATVKTKAGVTYTNVPVHGPAQYTLQGNITQGYTLQEVPYAAGDYGILIAPTDPTSPIFMDLRE